MELRKDVQLGVQGPGLIQVESIFPLPPKGPAGTPLDPGKIDLALLQKLEAFARKIRAHHRDHADRGEKARARRKIDRRAPQDFPGLAEGRLDRIQGHRSDDQDVHLGPRLNHNICL